jgi:hypothetical protein
MTRHLPSRLGGRAKKAFLCRQFDYNFHDLEFVFFLTMLLNLADDCIIPQAVSDRPTAMQIMLPLIFLLNIFHAIEPEFFYEEEERRLLEMMEIIKNRPQPHSKLMGVLWLLHVFADVETDFFERDHPTLSRKKRNKEMHSKNGNTDRFENEENIFQYNYLKHRTIQHVHKPYV